MSLFKKKITVDKSLDNRRPESIKRVVRFEHEIASPLKEVVLKMMELIKEGYGSGDVIFHAESNLRSHFHDSWLNWLVGIEDAEAEEYLREQMKQREGQIKPPEVQP